MLELAMVYAAPDADLVRRLGSYLERNCRVRIDYSLVVAPHQSVVEVLGCALGAAAVILFVSPHSVPRPLKREEWEPLMGEAGGEQEAPTAYVTVAPAPFPKVLLRMNAFDPSDETLCARALKRWILNLKPPAARPFIVRAGTAAASSAEIEALWRSAADQPGAVDTSAAVARAFIRAAKQDFQGVLWIDARGATMACAAGDLGAQLSFRLAGELPDNLADLRTLLNQYRCLVVIEQASPAVRAELSDLGLSSVLFVPSEELGSPTLEEARAQLQAIAGWIRNPQQVPPSGQMRHTMEWLLDDPQNWTLACDFARASLGYYRFHDRLAEAFELAEVLVNQAIHIQDPQAAVEFGRERGWILESWGRRPDNVHPFAAAPEPAVQLALW